MRFFGKKKGRLELEEISLSEGKCSISGLELIQQTLVGEGNSHKDAEKNLKKRAREMGATHVCKVFYVTISRRNVIGYGKAYYSP